MITFVNGWIARKNLKETIDKDVSTVYTHVDKRTNGLWVQDRRDMDARFEELARQLARTIHERIGREVDDVRRAMKGEKREE